MMTVMAVRARTRRPHVTVGGRDVLRRRGGRPTGTRPACLSRDSDQHLCVALSCLCQPRSSFLSLFIRVLILFSRYSQPGGGDWEEHHLHFVSNDPVNVNSAREAGTRSGRRSVDDPLCSAVARRPRARRVELVVLVRGGRRVVTRWRRFDVARSTLPRLALAAAAEFDEQRVDPVVGSGSGRRRDGAQSRLMTCRRRSVGLHSARQRTCLTRSCYKKTVLS